MLIALTLIAGSVCAQEGVLARSPNPATSPATRPSPQGKKLKVLCTVYPVYLFTKTVAAGSNLQVDLMLSANTGCPHDYSLTPQDMQKIATADILVANGSGLEEFLGDPIRQANPKVKVIDASAGIPGIILMAEKGETDHPAADKKEEGHHHHTGANPHLFADPKMVAQMVQHIAAGLATADPANAPLYAANAKAYADKMKALADEMAAAAKAFPSRKIVTEHAVFDYLARDMGLEVVAVVEEAPGQAPSAAQMLAIVKTIKSSGAAALFTEPQYPAKVGQTIAAEAKIPVAALDPVASGPADADGAYYEKTMRANLDTLKRILGKEAK